MVCLQPITEDNYRDAIGITVTEQQQNIIAPVVYSLAQSYVFFPELKPFLICDDEQPVGFILLGVCPEDCEYEVCRLMIDRNHQHKGYGRRAMILAIEYLKGQGASVIALSHRVDNPDPSALYLSLGFEYTGVIDGPERLMELKL